MHSRSWPARSNGTWQLRQSFSYLAWPSINLPGDSTDSSVCASAACAKNAAAATSNAVMNEDGRCRFTVDSSDRTCQHRQYTCTAITCAIALTTSTYTNGMCKTCHSENSRSYAANCATLTTAER